MAPTLQLRRDDDFAPLPTYDPRTVLANAQALQRAARAGAATQPLLRGKNFGLWCESADDADAALFRSAATELGAHVADVRPSLTATSTLLDVQHTARVLGRLYDAIECQGMSPALVAQVSRWAGVPVFDGLACAGHPSASLVDALDHRDTPAENRRTVLQAVLLSSVT
jgi:ornithine carbamoyltransferase